MIRVKFTLSCTWNVCGENIERVGPAPHHTLLSTTVSARTLRPAEEGRANKKENQGSQKGILYSRHSILFRMENKTKRDGRAYLEYQSQ